MRNLKRDRKNKSFYRYWLDILDRTDDVDELLADYWQEIPVNEARISNLLDLLEDEIKIFNKGFKGRMQKKGK